MAANDRSGRRIFLDRNELKFYAKLDLWTLSQTIFVVNGLRPMRFDTLEDTQFALKVLGESEGRKVRNAFALFTRGIMAEKLRFESDTTPQERRAMLSEPSGIFFEPSDALQFLCNKGLDVPDEFHHLVPDSTKEHPSLVDPEKFVRSLRASLASDSEIKFQEPRKKGVGYSCEQMGFSNADTREWRGLIEVLQGPTYRFEVGSPFKFISGKRSPKAAYGSRRKLLTRINAKLVRFFGRNFGIAIPSNFKFYEQCPGGGKGSYTFKFKIVADVDEFDRKEVSEHKAKFEDYSKDKLCRLIGENKAELSPEELCAAVEVAKEKHGMTEDEIGGIVSPKGKETLIYDPFENEEDRPPDD